MFAVIGSGGKQYRVREGDELSLERMCAEPGSRFAFGEVFLVGGDGETKVGSPLVGDVQVHAAVLEHVRGPKVLSFKRRRRKSSSRSLKGHRQELTRVRILAIGSGAEQPAESAG